MKNIKQHLPRRSAVWLRLTLKLAKFVRQAIIHPLYLTFFGFSPTCRYPESCLNYSQRVSQEYATIPAIRLIIKRVLSCHGWGKRGR